MSMKTIFHRLSIVILAALFAGNLQAAPLSAEEHAYLESQGEIAFAVQPNHAPFEFLRKKYLSGMNVELAQWMAADMSFKIRFEIAPLAEAILRKAGCLVDTAGNGQDAIQQIRKSSYDIVLMDCQMPVMDGFEAAAKIRAMHSDVSQIPIIAITAHAMKDDRQKGIDGGMNDYISKPVSRQDLIALINKYTRP